MEQRQNVDIKAAVRADWAGRAAAWNRWADQLAKMADRFNGPLIEAAGIGPGQRVLDLASGAGEPALTVARRVLPEGRVTATDLVPEMLAGARRRAAEAGIENIDFEIADMEALPFADAAFDRVTCRFGLMFVPDAGHALGEALRVLVPGGRAAYLVWGPRENTTLFAVMWDAAAEVVGSMEGFFALPPFRFADAGSVAELMERAGFEAVAEQELRVSGEMPAGTPFWRPQFEMSFAAKFAGQDEALRRVEAAIEHSFQTRRQGDVVRLDAHVRIISGQAPG